jgi:hypothetical protein
MLQSLILIDALSSACWEKKEEIKGEVVRGFFHRAGGWKCLPGFEAVRCN